MSAPDEAPTSSLSRYLDWLEEVWLPAMKAGRNVDPTSWEKPRPSLTLIQGGRDA
jgi:hypothetical protein